MLVGHSGGVWNNAEARGALTTVGISSSSFFGRSLEPDAGGATYSLLSSIPQSSLILPIQLIT